MRQHKPATRFGYSKIVLYVDHSSEPSARLLRAEHPEFQAERFLMLRRNVLCFLDSANHRSKRTARGLALAALVRHRARTSLVASSRWCTLQCKKRFGCAKKPLILC